MEYIPVFKDDNGLVEIWKTPGNRYSVYNTVAGVVEAKGLRSFDAAKKIADSLLENERYLEVEEFQLPMFEEGYNTADMKRKLKRAETIGKTYIQRK